MKPCPECGEPPHYHSWCTLCAQLFMVPPHQQHPAAMVQLFKWQSHREAMLKAVLAAHAEGLSTAQTAARTGSSKPSIIRWKRMLKLPIGPKGRPPHALAS